MYIDIDYKFRPTACENMSVVEFYCKMEKVKKNWSKNNTSCDDEGDTVTSKCHLKFLLGHPQSKTNAVRYRIVPAITCFIGPTFPRQDLETHNEIYGKHVLLFFYPWRELVDLKGKHQTWNERKLEWFNEPEAFPAWIHRMLNNIQCLHEGEDKRKQLQEENKSSRLNILDLGEERDFVGPFDSFYDEDERDSKEHTVC